MPRSPRLFFTTLIGYLVPMSASKTPSRKVVNTRFAKSQEYRKVIETIQGIGECPFCPENFYFHKKPILKKERGWVLTENSWPYKHTEKHFIIISPVHKETLSELTSKDIETILHLSQWVVQKYKTPGGALALRFGDTDCTGATVAHLHAHVICPVRDKKGVAKTVLFPIG